MVARQILGTSASEHYRKVGLFCGSCILQNLVEVLHKSAPSLGSRVSICERKDWMAHLRCPCPKTPVYVCVHRHTRALVWV